MANIIETATFDSGVYQLEITDPVAGGASGIDNTPHKNLANRTVYLKAIVDGLSAGTGALTPILSKSVAGSANITLDPILEAVYPTINLTGALTAGISVIVPAAADQWVIANNTTGLFPITVKTAAGAGIVVPQGFSMALYCDATNVLASNSSYTTQAAFQQNAPSVANAGGTADAITAAYTPAVLALSNGMSLFVRATSANSTTTPTFSPNGLTATIIVKGAGSALAAGDIAGAGHWIELQYDSTLGKWVLLNPATGVSVTSGITQTFANTLYAPVNPTITATVASSAMTVGVASQPLTFRSATLGSGAVSTITAAPASLVIPSGATLGTVAALQSQIVVIEMNNAGTAVLGVVNLAGGIDLSETGVISSTAISASATAANVVYSSALQTNLPYRVVGVITSTQATAGTWMTSPSSIQGVGGQAFAAIQSLGYGQTSQNLTASRALSTTYYNITGKLIWVNLTLTNTAGTNNFASFLKNGSTYAYGYAAGVSGSTAVFSVPILAGESYSCSITGGAFSSFLWEEVR